MKILVTGASGFIGSFIVEEGLRRGHEVWAGMRSTSSKQYLTDPNIRFAELDFAHPKTLKAQLAACKAECGGWDIVVHAAGATKCLRREGFFDANYKGTRNFADALRELKMVPRRFIFISSLSVYGAIREQPVRKAAPGHPWTYAPIQEGDTPRPNTAYGESKLQAERYLKSLPDFPYVILRPTGVYGPREKDYFVMAQSIRQHVDFCVGYKPQEITYEKGSGGHGGGDPKLLSDVFRGVTDDPLGHAAGYIDGARSILTGIAGNISMKTGMPVRVKDLVTF